MRIGRQFQRSRWARWFDRVTGSLFFLPLVAVAAAIAIAVGALAFDEGLKGDPPAAFLFTGSTDTARSLLSSLAAATVTLTGLAFSVTMLVMQLTSSQYSPRVLRTFLADRHAQITLAVFVGSFVYAMAVLRTIETPDSPVPGFSLSLAVLFGLATVAVFIWFISHIGLKIQAVSIIESVASETENAMDLFFPYEEPEIRGVPPAAVGPSHLITAQGKGVVETVDAARLLGVAVDTGAQIEVVPKIGEFVARGAPVLRVFGGNGDVPDSTWKAVKLGHYRTIADDPAFGFRQLVDIAERALSPGVNDPTTAVQALDQLHHLLRQLANRPFPTGVHYDEEGALRLIVPQLSWSDYLDLAVDEIFLYGKGSLQVRRRLEHMLCDLRDATVAARREAVEEKLEAVRAAPPLDGIDAHTER